MTQARDEAESPARPDFDATMPEPGRMVQLGPLVRRRVAGNASPFTASGTCTYVVGRGAVAVIDPGPEDPAHIEGLLADLAGESVSHILVTHTHRDHSPGARLLAARTGAPILGCGPHRAARALAEGELPALDASADREHQPERILKDGETLSGAGWTLAAVATPGHTMNHLAFALAQEEALFSGDHVMAWSTSIVAPPDGSMRAYMASLERLRARTETVYWPGHGGPVRDPARLVRALLHHRRQREAAIQARIAAGDGDIRAIVAAIYQGLDPRLVGAAMLSVFAHVEDLVDRGLAACDGPPRIEGRYRPGPSARGA